uniref:Cyclin I family member 2 n=1 Tax=Molossus molossus TaxID=27622 RepID=A0A7J8I453_MOLMO|nr:cyclin I family member 2 [Molossus molossus]
MVMDGDGWWERKLTSAPHCCLRDEPSQMPRTDLLKGVDLIKERLLHIVTITSWRLAAKVKEEGELIPRIKDFMKHYGSGYTPNELLRMELAILDKLHWDLYIGKPLDFLTIVTHKAHDIRNSENVS